jgi:hypothetical protein
MACPAGISTKTPSAALTPIRTHLSGALSGTRADLSGHVAGRARTASARCKVAVYGLLRFCGLPGSLRAYIRAARAIKGGLRVLG